MIDPSLKYQREPSLKNEILSTVAYFDMFSYPLTKREIWLFLQNLSGQENFDDSLDALVDTAALYRLGEYYSLHNNYSIANRRISGNNKALELLKKAPAITGFLSCFPYVRGVAISGSLSKNYADENADMDLFIITARNRLWIARTLLHLFKKFTFLVKRQHLFCMNYFISESDLEIAEKNIYTATEIATLMPYRGAEAFEQFYASNRWMNGFLPNKYLRVTTAEKIKDPWWKWVVEKIFNNAAGNVLDEFLMNLTDRRWRKKTLRDQRNSRGMVMGMSASRSCAKPLPLHFQNKILELYDRKVFGLLNKKMALMNPVP